MIRLLWLDPAVRRTVIWMMPLSFLVGLRCAPLLDPSYRGWWDSSALLVPLGAAAYGFVWPYLFAFALFVRATAFELSLPIAPRRLWTLRVGSRMVCAVLPVMGTWLTLIVLKEGELSPWVSYPLFALAAVMPLLVMPFFVISLGRSRLDKPEEAFALHSAVFTGGVIVAALCSIFFPAGFLVLASAIAIPVLLRARRCVGQGLEMVTQADGQKGLPRAVPVVSEREKPGCHEDEQVGSLELTAFDRGNADITSVAPTPILRAPVDALLRRYVGWRYGKVNVICAISMGCAVVVMFARYVDRDMFGYWLFFGWLSMTIQPSLLKPLDHLPIARRHLAREFWWPRMVALFSGAVLGLGCVGIIALTIGFPTPIEVVFTPSAREVKIPHHYWSLELSKDGGGSAGRLVLTALGKTLAVRNPAYAPPDASEDELASAIQVAVLRVCGEELPLEGLRDAIRSENLVQTLESRGLENRASLILLARTVPAYLLIIGPLSLLPLVSVQPRRSRTKSRFVVVLFTTPAVSVVVSWLGTSMYKFPAIFGSRSGQLGRFLEVAGGALWGMYARLFPSNLALSVLISGTLVCVLWQAAIRLLNGAELRSFK